MLSAPVLWILCDIRRQCDASFKAAPVSRRYPPSTFLSSFGFSHSRLEHLFDICITRIHSRRQSERSSTPGRKGRSQDFFRKGSNCHMSEKPFIFFLVHKAENKTKALRLRSGERYCGMFWSTLKVIRSGKMVQLYVNKCLVAYEDNVIGFHRDFSAEVRETTKGLWWRSAKKKTARERHCQASDPVSRQTFLDSWWGHPAAVNNHIAGNGRLENGEGRVFLDERNNLGRSVL